ncbi:DUF2812 domain-containing protein [Bacillus tequilensis]|uniref:DUF2812 domain-containing protein n=1 Tax=Bacillus tequilensis TaxID=227866 RepID=UPI0015763D0B|nr:DUF2812 domain-containing protein [Bacillus tequilensis]NTU26233.1 DUF2812 domain-containing protein [Bacillus tequilensis]
MKKYRYFMDIDSEEQWLNKMAYKGCELEGRGLLSYRFADEASSDNSTIRIDYRTFTHPEDFTDYRTLFEDSGWKHLFSSQGLHYFRKEDANASDDIFSDTESRAGRYKRLLQTYFALSFLFLSFIFILYTTKALTIDLFIRPQSLYYTPGLWDKTGAAFIRAFLFETPIALMRGGAGWIVLFSALSFFYLFMKTYKKYRKCLYGQ